MTIEKYPFNKSSTSVATARDFFPVWLKFKGGKGVATYLGVILALSYKFFLIFVITWIILSFLFRYASLSSIVSSLIVFVYSYFYINDFSFILFIRSVHPCNNNVYAFHLHKIKKFNNVNFECLRNF